MKTLVHIVLTSIKMNLNVYWLYKIIIFICYSLKKMKLFALESNNNDQYRNIRKKQFNLHSQQKLIYRDVFRNSCDVDFKKI